MLVTGKVIVMTRRASISQIPVLRKQEVVLMALKEMVMGILRVERVAVVAAVTLRVTTLAGDLAVIRAPVGRKGEAGKKTRKAKILAATGQVTVLMQRALDIMQRSG